MAAILEARNVCFEYEPERPVIRGISMAPEAGTLCALIGSNGSGKSTFVRLLAGILAPGSGEILLNGRPLPTTPKMVAARHLAYVPQATAMVFPFTALEVVMTGRSPFRRPFRFEDEHDHECALKALETAGAQHLANRAVTTLSGGEQQLVMVARALAQEPTCLLLDEPSSSLDLKHRSSLMRTLVRLRDALGLTIIVVTHDLHLIGGDFDRVTALRDGRIFTDGKPAEVLNESTLAAVYQDDGIRTRSVDGHTLVWCE